MPNVKLVPTSTSVVPIDHVLSAAIVKQLLVFICAFSAGSTPRSLLLRRMTVSVVCIEIGIVRRPHQCAR
jgi:hypothetical protein